MKKIFEQVEHWLNKLETNPSMEDQLSKAPRNRSKSFIDELNDWSDEQISPVGDTDSNLGIPSVEDVDAATSARTLAGIDVLAFYKSFRFASSSPFRGRWGVFLLDVGIKSLANEVLLFENDLTIQEANSLAVDILKHHEIYHYWIDCWALGHEIAPVVRNVKLYEYYLLDKIDDEYSEFDLEESLANYYAYGQLKSLKLSNGGLADSVVKKILSDSPVPYSNFDLSLEERIKAESDLLDFGLFQGGRGRFL